MKTGWSEVTLGDVASINPRLVDPPPDDESVSFIPMAELTITEARTTAGTLRPFCDVSKGYTHFHRDDILVAKITPCFENGKIGRAAIGTAVGAGSTEFHVVRPNPERLDPGYALRFLRRGEVRQQGTLRMTGSAGQRRVPASFLEALRIPLPPLDEQRKIVWVLDRVDALRAKRRATLKAHDLLSQAQFLSRFGDPFSNPMRWPLVPLGDLFSEKPVYGTMIPGDPEHGQWLCLRVANINGWNLDLSNRKFVDLPISEQNRHEVRDGDLLLARAIASEALLGKAVIAEPGMRRWAFDSHLMRLRFDLAKAEPRFIRELLRSRGGRTRFMRVTRRSAVQFNVNTKEIAALEVPCPEIALQSEFGMWQGRVNDLQRRAEVHLDHLATLFSILQHRAFNGEL